MAWSKLKSMFVVSDQPAQSTDDVMKDLEKYQVPEGEPGALPEGTSPQMLSGQIDFQGLYDQAGIPNTDEVESLERFLIGLDESLPATAKVAAATQQFVDVREVSVDTLHDVALTVITKGLPTIYYNTRLMQDLGPGLAAFAMAHEFGHVRYGHTGGAFGDPGAPDTELRVRQELEADCYAARILAETDPAAVAAAWQYFNHLGPFRFDRVHPAGSQRAATIDACRAGDRPKPPTS